MLFIIDSILFKKLKNERFLEKNKSTFQAKAMQGVKSHADTHIKCILTFY